MDFLGGCVGVMFHIGYSWVLWFRELGVFVIYLRVEYGIYMYFISRILMNFPTNQNLCNFHILFSAIYFQYALLFISIYVLLI
jgi:hypothetical protein